MKVRQRSADDQTVSVEEVKYDECNAFDPDDQSAGMSISE